MDQPLLTRCPHCQTLFHIRQEDLDIANGEVRCGLCLQAFHAADQGANGSSESPATPPPTELKQAQEPRKTAPESIDPAHKQNKYSLSATPVSKHTPPLLGQELIPSSEEISVLEIEVESIDSILTQKSRPVGRKLSLWLGLSLASALLLASQWAWFNRSTLSQLPKLRPWYVTICSQLNCEIPAYLAIPQIHTQALAIRADPNQSGQLTIDLVITNRAEFSQPLPGLTLQFFDLNQNLLAQRTFQPREYLNPSSSLQYMPVNVAIHISFSIIEPNGGAVNYSVQLTPADNPG